MIFFLTFPFSKVSKYTVHGKVQLLRYSSATVDSHLWKFTNHSYGGWMAPPRPNVSSILVEEDWHIY